LIENDTIAAISTPLGEGGIGIVRLSGPESFNIASKIFEISSKKASGFPVDRFLYHGFIKDFQNNIVDEVLVAYMSAPHTYTREDIVEINCHSGIFTLRTIQKLVLEAGASLAEPGEFTKRAFINGRIDLSQAEAVMNMVRARSEQAVKIAARGLQGEVTSKVEKVRESIIAMRAPLEALFDYPEEFPEEELSVISLTVHIEDLIGYLKEMLKGTERNRAYQEGVSVAIIGKPNVGKSSLLNILLQQQRAIVHELPGTTRDVLEGYLNLGGYPIRLIDTAGIQGTIDPVEKQGIDLSRSAAGQAKLIIMVLDGSENWSEEDQEILNLRQQDQGFIIVINKSDLKRKLKPDIFSKYLPDVNIVEASALEGTGIKELEEAVVNQLDRKYQAEKFGESPIIVTIRHEESIKHAVEHLEKAKEITTEQPLELVSLELQNAWDKLGEITGDTINEDLLDKIFKEFCLGK